MPRQGLTKEAIVEESIALIEEKGAEEFSLRGLAARLGIKTASLYNHISGADDLMTAIGLRAIGMLQKTLEDISGGLEGDKAIFEMTIAYRSFAKEHPEVYKTLLMIPKTGVAQLHSARTDFLEPFVKVIKTYHLNKNDEIDFIRHWRSAIHGFVILEESRYLQNPNVSADTSYEHMTRSLIETLHSMQKEEEH